MCLLLDSLAAFYRCYLAFEVGSAAIKGIALIAGAVLMLGGVDALAQMTIGRGLRFFPKNWALFILTLEAILPSPSVPQIDGASVQKAADVVAKGKREDIYLWYLWLAQPKLKLFKSRLCVISLICILIIVGLSIYYWYEALLPKSVVIQVGPALLTLVGIGLTFYGTTINPKLADLDGTSNSVNHFDIFVQLLKREQLGKAGFRFAATGVVLGLLLLVAEGPLHQNGWLGF